MVEGVGRQSIGGEMVKVQPWALDQIVVTRARRIQHSMRDK